MQFHDRGARRRSVLPEIAALVAVQHPIDITFFVEWCGDNSGHCVSNGWVCVLLLQLPRQWQGTHTVSIGCRYGFFSGSELKIIQKKTFAQSGEGMLLLRDTECTSNSIHEAHAWKIWPFSYEFDQNPSLSKRSTNHLDILGNVFFQHLRVFLGIFPIVKIMYE